MADNAEHPNGASENRRSYVNDVKRWGKLGGVVVVLLLLGSIVAYFMCADLGPKMTINLKEPEPEQVASDIAVEQESAKPYARVEISFQPDISKKDEDKNPGPWYMYRPANVGVVELSFSNNKIISECVGGVNKIDALSWRVETNLPAKIPRDICKTNLFPVEDGKFSVEFRLKSRLETNPRISAILDFFSKILPSLKEYQAALKSNFDGTETKDTVNVAIDLPTPVASRAEGQQSNYLLGKAPARFVDIKVDANYMHAKLGRFIMRVIPAGSPLVGAISQKDWVEQEKANLALPNNGEPKIGLVGDFVSTQAKKSLEIVLGYMAKYVAGHRLDLSEIRANRSLRTDGLCGDHFNSLRHSALLSARDAAALVFLFHYATPTYQAYEYLDSAGDKCDNHTYTVAKKELNFLSIDLGDEREDDKLENFSIYCDNTNSKNKKKKCIRILFNSFRSAMKGGESESNRYDFLTNASSENVNAIILENFSSRLSRPNLRNKLKKTIYGADHVGCYEFSADNPAFLSFLWVPRNEHALWHAKVKFDRNIKITDLELKLASEGEIKSKISGSDAFKADSKCREELLTQKKRTAFEEQSKALKIEKSDWFFKNFELQMLTNFDADMGV